MLSALAMLVVAATRSFCRFDRSPIAVAKDLAWLFWPSALLLLPAGAALAAGILVRDGFTMGGAKPFSLAHFLTSYGDLLRFMAGLPRPAPEWVTLGIVGTGAWLAGRCGLLRKERQTLLAAACLILPGLMLAARLPNLEYPRYFLASGVVLLLCMGDAFGRLWHRAGAWRWAGAVLLAGVLAGQVWPLESLLVDGRGEYSSALVHMASQGRTTYASNVPFATRMVVDHLAPGRDFVATPRDLKACTDPRPEWLIESSTADAEAPLALILGPAACRAEYERDARYLASPLSGLTWTLYRLAAEVAPR